MLKEWIFENVIFGYSIELDRMGLGGARWGSRGFGRSWKSIWEKGVGIKCKTKTEKKCVVTIDRPCLEGHRLENHLYLVDSLICSIVSILRTEKKIYLEKKILQDSKTFLSITYAKSIEILAMNE